MFLKRCILFLTLGASLVCQGQQKTLSIASIESLIRSQEYDQALQATKSALRREPRDYRLWTLEGIILSMKGNNHEGRIAFQKALQLSPDNIAALKGEVQLLYQAHDPSAVSLLKRILRLSPGDETAHEMLANLEASDGECQAAIDHFLLSAEAISHHPESLEVYGRCLVQTGQIQKAIPIFEQLAISAPQLTYPKYDLAVLLDKDKDYEAAIKVLEPVLAGDPKDPDVLSLASEAYEAVGNTPKAASLLRSAIVLRPTDANLYVSFADLCMDHNSFQVGIDMMNAGLQRIPNDPSLYISRGSLYAQLSEFDKAESDFDTAERLDPRQSFSSYGIDLAQLQEHHFDPSHSQEAVQEIRSQLKAHPDSAQLHFLLARLLSSQDSSTSGDANAEAINAALIAVKLNPSLIDARDLLATMYLRSGKYALAAEQCQLVLQHSPSDMSAMYHLIAALRHSNQPEQQAELKELVKRLSDLEKSSLQQETARKRFILVEQPPPPAN